MQTTHESIILVLTREKATFAKSRAARSIPPRRLNLPILLLVVYLILADRKYYTWIREYIACKSKNWANGRVMRVGINMPLLIAVAPHLVTFAFDKAKNKAIVLPVNVQNMHIHNIF